MSAINKAAINIDQSNNPIDTLITLQTVPGAYFHKCKMNNSLQKASPYQSLYSILLRAALTEHESTRFDQLDLSVWGMW